MRACGCSPVSECCDERQELVVLLLLRFRRFFGDDRDDVFVEDLRLAVGQFLEARERRIQLAFAFERDAQLLQTLLERIAARQLAEHDLVRAPAHIFGAHDFVGVTRLQHAVLVNARCVRKRIRADHGLVRLHDETGDLRHQLRRRHDLRGVDAEIEAEVVLAGLHRHHDFFERRIARALAETVDRALDLTRTANLHAGERIRHRHAEVVMAMHGEHRLVRIRNTFAQRLHELAVQFRHAIADRIRDIDGRRAFGDHRFQHAAQEIHVRAAAVFRRELDVVGELARETALRASPARTPDPASCAASFPYAAATLQ